MGNLVAVAAGWDDNAGESWRSLDSRAFVFERAAAALERSAVLAAQHAARHQRAEKLELAERERRAGEQARRAAGRARGYAGGLSDLGVGG